MSPQPSEERGMILINVLVIVMLATAVLAIMLASADTQAERSTTLRSASEAMATARGGELSAIVALRRDLASGSQSDTLTEPWAHITDTDARIMGGNFSFAVSDAQSRFNINNLAHSDTSAMGAINALAANAGVQPAQVTAIAAYLNRYGPVRQMSDLTAAGLDDGQVQRLAMLCTALPPPTTVNINTAPEALVMIMTGSQATTHTIMLAREKGGIAPDGTVTLATGPSSDQIILSPGTGVSSDYFWSRARVTRNGVTQQLTTLLHRRLAQDKPVVVAIERWRSAAPLGAPAFAP